MIVFIYIYIYIFIYIYILIYIYIHIHHIDDTLFIYIPEKRTLLRIPDFRRNPAVVDHVSQVCSIIPMVELSMWIAFGAADGSNNGVELRVGKEVQNMHQGWKPFFRGSPSMNNIYIYILYIYIDYIHT